MGQGLEERMLRIKESLVGIWLFREPLRTPRWCATFVYRGHYYDVSGKHSPLSAVKAVEKRVKDLDKANAAPLKKEKKGRSSSKVRKKK